MVGGMINSKQAEIDAIKDALADFNEGKQMHAQLSEVYGSLDEVDKYSEEGYKNFLIQGSEIGII